MLLDHLRFWARVVAQLVPGRRPQLTWTVFDAVLAERFEEAIRPALADLTSVEVVVDPGRIQGAGYYRGAAIGLRARDDQGFVVDLGDGGVTDRTARLRSGTKERCVISCIALEWLDALAE